MSHAATSARPFAPAVLAVGLFAGACALAPHNDETFTSAFRSGVSQHTVAAGTESRSYYLHVPAQRPRRLGIAQSFPLLLLLHGSGADGQTVRRMSRMDSLSDVRRFVVVYPNGSTGALGLRSDWNAGLCCGPAAARGIDDVKFIRSVIAEVETKLPIDRSRIYVAGFSDGARMTYRVACEMSGEIAAIGIVSGSMVDTTCAPTRHLPVIAFHGTADAEVPFSDTLAPSLRRANPYAIEVPPSIVFWAAANGCRSVQARREGPHVLRSSYAGCGGAEVVFYSVEQGRHAWPGGARDGDGDVPTPEISASILMAGFFARHAAEPQRSRPLIANVVGPAPGGR